MNKGNLNKNDFLLIKHLINKRIEYIAKRMGEIIAIEEDCNITTYTTLDMEFSKLEDELSKINDLLKKLY